MSLWPIASDEEIRFRGEVAPRDNSMQTKRVQEHLTLHGFGLPIDGGKKGGGYGRITTKVVKAFQAAKGLDVTGVVDEATWNALVQPLRDALAPLELAEGESMKAAWARLLKRFLAAGVREVGGDNCGPWVRTFMRGLEGPKQQWCAGFICTAYEMLCQAFGIPNVLGHRVNCTALVDAAQRLSGVDQLVEFVQGEKVPAGAFGIGVVEKEDRSDDDERYSHTYGFTDVEDGVAKTYEGNFGSGVKAGVHEYHRDLRKNDAIVFRG